MKKKLKIFSLMLVMLLAAAMLFPASVLASADSDNYDDDHSGYYSSEYTIDAYDIDMTVNTDNSYDITETITANFYVPKHGIFRKLPLTNKIVRADGSKSSNRARVKNVSVDSKYTTNTDSGNYVIKIGDPDKTITGIKTYEIKYTYAIGVDPLKKNDELYFNLIGTGWDTSIANVTFTIRMPKDFDKEKLGFSAGAYGTIDDSSISYTVDENIIKGSYSGKLYSGEALTVRCELPDEYFDGYDLYSLLEKYWIYLVPFILMIIVFIIWLANGKPTQPVETVEFYPPDGMNSVDVGYLYKGSLTTNHVISLLIYLATKGYIMIGEDDENDNSSKSNESSFTLTKLKHYDGQNIVEKKFIEGLFRSKGGAVGSPVRPNDLEYIFHATISWIKSHVDTSENKKIIFDVSCLKSKVWANVILYSCYILLSIRMAMDSSDFGGAIVCTIISAVGFLLLFNILFSDWDWFEKAVFMIIGGLCAAVGFYFMVAADGMPTTMDLIGYFSGIACAGIMTFFISRFKRRTQYGNEMLGKINGFRNFLETAEKEKLEALVEDDPTYFYNILPYTYALEISDKWIKKFESIAIQQPTWYESSRPFTMATFNDFMNRTMSSATSTMTSTPKSTVSVSSSGGGGGGGFSGGGSGGGGGGSW